MDCYMMFVEKKWRRRMIRLTERENDIVNLLIQGLTNKEIGSRLFISPHTVKATLEKIYDKYGIHNRILLAIHISQQKAKEQNNQNQ